MILKLYGTFNFVLIVMVPVDNGGSVSPNVVIVFSLCFTPRCQETSSLGGELMAASETVIPLVAEATGIQPEQNPAPFHLMWQKNPTQWQALRITIRN